MKKILVTLMALVAITLGAQAQGMADIKRWIYEGGTGKSYIDHSTLDRRSRTYHHLINDKSRDVKLCIRKDGKKAWYSFVGGQHFVGYYDESITMTEKTYLAKRKKAAAQKKATAQKNATTKKSTKESEASNAFSVDAISVFENVQ